MSSEPRRDLVEALLQCCWLVEAARAEVLTRWGGDFAEDAERTAERTARARRVLEERDVALPADVLDAHTFWLNSLVGSTPEAVPLGAGLLTRLGAWTDVYLAPYLDDPDAFRALGEGELRFPIPPRHITEDEVVYQAADLPSGRRFVVFTDIHIGAGTEEIARIAIEEINALEPEFVLIPGDITEDGEPEQFAAAAEILGGLQAPVHAVLGNHDAVRRSTIEPVGAKLYAEAFGHEPEDVVLECGPIQVALVDSTDPTPSPFPDWDLGRGGFREDAGGTNNGALAPGQAEALAERIDPSRPALIVLHHELQPFPAFPPVMFGMRRADSEALLDALSGHRIVGIVAGHTHRSALLDVGKGSIPQLEVPSLKDWPYCYTVVGVRDDGVEVVPRQIGDPKVVWERAEHVPPIYLNYVTGPLARPSHTFSL